MSRKFEFHMPDWIKSQMVSRHQFYVDQARSRLLTQFENLEADAEKASNEWLSQNEHRFDPDRHDPGDFYDRANDIGADLLHSLYEMREQTRLSVVAGMFHQWDKELRDWMTKEIGHWGALPNFTNQVRAATFDDITTLLAICGWDVRALQEFADLDTCRWVVNAYKHGEGLALRKLRELYPRFLTQSYPAIQGYTPDIAYRTHSDITVSDADIEMFSAAIVGFWRALPAIIDGSAIKSSINLPRKLAEAWEKDVKP